MLVAVAERGDKPSITLYDPFTYKRKKQIIITEKDVSATELVSIVFTYDSKNILAVTGEPDWHLYVYRADKGKLESDCRANNSNNTGTVAQVSIIAQSEKTCFA